MTVLTARSQVYTSTNLELKRETWTEFTDALWQDERNSAPVQVDKSTTLILKVRDSDMEYRRWAGFLYLTNRRDWAHPQPPINHPQPADQ